MEVGHFLNENAGLWAFVALPLLLVGTMIAVLQVLPSLRTAARGETSNLSLLRKRIERRRVEFDLRPRLVLGTLLRLRMRRSSGGATLTPEDLYEAMRDGEAVFVTGVAGSGKTILSLTLVEIGVRNSEENPQSPLIEVLRLTGWRPGIVRSSDWKGLIGWMAGEMAAAYPSFSKRHFKRLLKSQRLIPCLDGLDEVPNHARPSLLRALRSYVEAGFPLTVLSRDRTLPAGAGSLGSEHPSMNFNVLELVPLQTAEIARLEDHSGLMKMTAASAQPHRIAKLLSNPLTLSIAAQTWADEESRAVAEAGDPEDALWTAYLDKSFGPQGNGRGASTPRDRAGWVALLAHQEHLDNFRVWDLYVTSPARWLAAIAVTIPVAVACWSGRSGGLAALALMACYVGLTPRGRQWYERAGRWLAPGYARVVAFPLSVLLLAFAIDGFLVFGVVGESFFRRVLMPTMSWDPLFFHPLAHGAAATWWSEYGWPDIRFISWPPVWLWFLPAIVWLAYQELVPRPWLEEAFSRKMPRAVFPVAGAMAVLLWSGLVFPSNFGAILIGSILILPWLYRGMSAASLSFALRMRLGGLRSTCEMMSRAGALRADGSRFRFRHATFSTRLAQESVARLADDGRLDFLLRPESMYELIDFRVRAPMFARAGALARALVEARPETEAAQVTWAMYCCYGVFAPAAAMPALKRHLRTNPNSYAKVHLAEWLDAEGQHDEASKVWPQVVERHDWLAYKWIRREVMLDRAARAINRLKSRIESSLGYLDVEKLRLAELQCRFGSEEEFDAAVTLLGKMRQTESPTLSVWATVELARVKAEQMSEHEEAEQMLSASFGHGPFDSLLYTRCAQLCLLRDDPIEAEKLSREAFALLCWDDDPSEQLEVSLTTLAAVPGLAAPARERAEGLIELGWHLPRRDRRQAAGVGLEGEPLADRAFRS